MKKPNNCFNCKKLKEETCRFSKTIGEAILKNRSFLKVSLDEVPCAGEEFQKIMNSPFLRK